MNSGQTAMVGNGNRTSPVRTVARGARQTVGAAVTVVGSVGCVAGKLIDGAGTVLDTAASAVSGTVLLLGDVLNTTGHVLGSTVAGLGGTLTMAGGLVSGGSFASAGAARVGTLTEPVMKPGAVDGGSSGLTAKPKKAPTKRTRPGGASRPPAPPA